MPHLADLFDALGNGPAWGYRRDSIPCSEPTALVALALLAGERLDEAQAPLAWLADRQQSDGSVAISAAQSSPHWPTSLALFAWETARSLDATSDTLTTASRRAVDWLLSTSGAVLPPTPHIGHDTTLRGWPWVESTHSWLEPTVWSVLALKAAGHDQHPRVREAVQLLIDRLLPEGGCNYGNSFILGATLRPHVAPSGLVLMALVNETDPSGRIERTIDYLQSVVSAQLAPVSLSYALLGLGAHGVIPRHSKHWLGIASQRALDEGSSPLALALLALAMISRPRPASRAAQSDTPFARRKVTR